MLIVCPLLALSEERPGIEANLVLIHSVSSLESRPIKIRILISLVSRLLRILHSQKSTGPFQAVTCTLQAGYRPFLPHPDTGPLGTHYTKQAVLTGALLVGQIFFFSVHTQ